MSSAKVTSNMISLMSRQSLRASRMRNVFVMITIVLASALLTAILMFGAGQKQQEKNQLSHQQQVGYYNLTKEQVAQLAADDRIAYQLRVKTGILSEMDGFDVMPYFVNELSDQIRVGELDSGKLPESEQEITAYAAMLEKMGAEPALGSSITLSFYDGSTETFTISGLLKGNDSAKQFPVFFSEAYAEHGSQLKGQPYEVYAKLYGGTEMYLEDCKEAMYLIGSDAGVARENVYPSQAFLDSLSVDMQSVMLYGLVGIVILLACILVIYGVFYLSVIGRIHQFGQLRTIGMTRKQIKRLVSREGGILFLCSSPIGIGIGGIAGYLMIPDGFHIGNLLLIIVSVFVLVYLITMISVRKPARLAGAVSPMEALRYVPQGSMKKAANKRMCRRLTPQGLGLMNFSKNRKKAVITMLSLGLGGILFMTAATYISSFDKDGYARQGYFKDAEFNIQFSVAAIELNEYGMSGLQAESPLGSAMVQEISALAGVTGVREIKAFGVQYDHPANDLYGANDQINPLTEGEVQSIGRYLEEGSCDYEKLMSGDYVLVADNDTMEEIYGWRFAVGDRITLHYYDGAGAAQREVSILGILSAQYIHDHNDSFEGWFLMPEQAILSLVNYDSLNTHLLVSTEAAREEAVGEALGQMIADRPELVMETLSERRAAYAQSANQIFGAISGLSIFIMMFSILSMMNTLITNIVTRKQELAMLTSIGMGKGQTRGMLLCESLFLVLVTLGVTMTIGTLCGYALSQALYRNGAFYMAFQFPAVFALAYGCVLILVPLAITFGAMGSFSKEPLVERLRGSEN